MYCFVPPLEPVYILLRPQSAIISTECRSLSLTRANAFVTLSGTLPILLVVRAILIIYEEYLLKLYRLLPGSRVFKLLIADIKPDSNNSSFIEDPDTFGTSDRPF